MLTQGGLDGQQVHAAPAILEKAIGEPGSMAVYRELIITDALHLSVEQSGVQSAGHMHDSWAREGRDQRQRGRYENVTFMDVTGTTPVPHY